MVAVACLANVAEGKLAGRWLGQDGHDRVGLNAERRGNGTQDVHVSLTGLPAERRLAFAKLEGQGGDEWQYGGPPSSWLAEIARREGSTSADLFFEPCRREAGRPFHLALRFADGSVADCWIEGGPADPNRRMPTASLRVSWGGQADEDRVGPTAAVGPDGFRDVRLVLECLSPGVEVRAVTVIAPDKVSWESGLNPRGVGSAELLKREGQPTVADLWLGLDRDRREETWRVVVAYADGKTDRAQVVAGVGDPRAKVPAVALPRFVPNAIAVRWEGQDGGEGDVRLRLSGPDAARPVVAASLSDAVSGTWAWMGPDSGTFSPEPYARSLGWTSDEVGASLGFSPTRDESGASMTLRLSRADGTSTVVRFPGGPCDPGRRGMSPPTTRAEAAPGVDLQDLASRFGTVLLKAGEHRRNRPLVLSRPITLEGEPGARLIFEQSPDEAPWSSAIKLHAGRTTLRGFSVRFAGPIRWAEGVDYGPSVIGSTDNLDKGAPPGLRLGVVLDGLDVEAPPAARDGEEAPRTIRLATMENGRIEHNRLKGGPVELIGGPWVVADNAFRGTPVGTHSFAMIGLHRTHDVRVSGNRAVVESPSGKVWRFLVMTDRGAGDVVEGNVVEGVGPKDGDPGPDPNAAEIVLTESYRLHFEGKPLAASDDGRVLAIPPPPGGPARAGSVVALLTGPKAGRWVRVAQALDERTYLLDEPLPVAGQAVTIVSGFVGETFRGNTVDARGGSAAAPFVLGGNHFGTRFLDNRILGGGEGFRILSTPTESPGPWGWSHSPMLGLLVAGNRVEGSGRGATLAVEHGPPIQSNRGRLYLTATVAENTFRASGAGPARGLTIGDPGSLDPAEALLVERGTRVERPDGSAEPEPPRVLAGWINGTRWLGGRPWSGGTK